MRFRKLLTQYILTRIKISLTPSIDIWNQPYCNLCNTTCPQKVSRYQSRIDRLCHLKLIQKNIFKFRKYRILNTAPFNKNKPNSGQSYRLWSDPIKMSCRQRTTLDLVATFSRKPCKNQAKPLIYSWGRQLVDNRHISITRVYRRR